MLIDQPSLDAKEQSIRQPPKRSGPRRHDVPIKCKDASHPHGSRRQHAKKKHDVEAQKHKKTIKTNHEDNAKGTPSPNSCCFQEPFA
ncbi:hypothetical protein M747DRAFT_23804 [Aspergillus niger ATCC 13496]|uniref:Uncharacterized protein n=1 Tax=Aspergillus niger ATCC 13496 TaxID=1353008 RepID=A0A370C647_ASPNG|nr:hypothetical protein M747DRAFT_23804 [Aspergillus niger ATCC 13496]